MQHIGYQSDELKLFNRVLREAQRDLIGWAHDVPVDDIVEKLFDVASNGERDPKKLKAAILDRLGSGKRGAAASAVGKRGAPRNTRLGVVG